MDTASLEELGLSKTEAKVYLALLRIGSGTGSEIAEKADVFRRNAYDALNRLGERGLVNRIIKEKTYYSVAPPEKLLDILREKESYLNELLPKLRELYTHPKIKQKVFFYEGREGVKTVMNEIIKEGKDWLCFGASGQSKAAFGEWVDYWEKRRAKAGIPSKILMANTPEGRKRGKEIEALVARKHTEVRIVEEQFASPASTYVFGGRMAIVLWSDIEPLAILVESKEIAAANRRYFELLWKTAKKY